MRISLLPAHLPTIMSQGLDALMKSVAKLNKRRLGSLIEIPAEASIADALDILRYVPTAPIAPGSRTQGAHRRDPPAPRATWQTWSDRS